MKQRQNSNGIIIFLIALLLQMFVVGIFQVFDDFEVFGPRGRLASLWLACYMFPIRILLSLLPVAWDVRGNVLFGFMLIFVAMIVYAAAFTTVFFVSMWFIRQAYKLAFRTFFSR